MGTYSWFITTRNNAEGCKINWEAMDTEKIFKSSVLKHCYHSSPRPETVLEVAKQFDERKLIGYLTNDILEALYEFSKQLIPYGCFPRLYYDYEGDDQIWCIEFVPGSKQINWFVFNYENLLEVSINSRDKIIEKSPELRGWKQINIHQ